MSCGPSIENRFLPTLGAMTLGAVLGLCGNVAHAVADKYATASELKLMEGSPPPLDKRVDRSNAMMTPPYNRWSYLHMRTVYPTADIPAADAPVHLDKKIDSAIDGLKVTNPESGKQVDMGTYLKETYSDSLVIIQSDTIVYEHYDNSMTPDQPHQMMSVTKSFAGLMNLIAEENGKVKESDPVIKYLPELKGSAFDTSVGHVLDMTNSMDFYAHFTSTLGTDFVAALADSECC